MLSGYDPKGSHPMSAADAFTLNQLRYLLTVVEEQSFTRAAAKLSISQPALSRQIALLERKLKVRLLERAGAGALPTVAGRALSEDARAVLSLSDRISRTAAEVGHLEAGTLRIATFPSLVSGTLLAAIRRWYAQHPKVQIQLFEYHHRNAMQEAVRTGTADFAIGTAPHKWAGPERSVAWNELMAVLPERDLLQKTRAAVNLRELMDRNWVLYSKDFGLSDVATAACLHAGFKPNTVIETSNAETAARLAAAGLGPTLVPFGNVPPELSRFARRLSVPFAWEIVAFTRSNWSATSLAFLKIVSEENPRTPPAKAIQWHG